jgi:hypothetical protein
MPLTGHANDQVLMVLLGHVDESSSGPHVGRIAIDSYYALSYRV